MGIEWIKQQMNGGDYQWGQQRMRDRAFQIFSNAQLGY
ncbi:conserved hypothetical protein [delta proteobacterium NaphS2]|nr:conserved hypothetical protein [delta proteobacterium NaphS2]